MKKVAVLIDGNFMFRRIVREHAFQYTANEIVNYCKKHADLADGRELYRIFYYDAAPNSSSGHRPISKSFIDFGKSDVYKKSNALHDAIKQTNHMALRLGHLQWTNNEWKLTAEATKQLIKGTLTPNQLIDDHFQPAFTQKGVDMKIGLDIASLAYKRLVDIIVVITGDQDFVPAMKLARREGIIVILDSLGVTPNKSLHEHTDIFKTYIIKSNQSNPAP